MKSRQSSAKSLASALDDVLDAFSLTRVRDYDAVVKWPEIVGEQIARVTEAVKIDKGVLVVRVTNGPWRNELTLMKGTILEKINTSTGRSSVRDIRFV
jgi:predicted nucleic acid-binding Zn ribbon protein